MIYKVLWVDDDDSIVESTQQDADSFGLDLDRYSNWQEAEAALKSNFEDYSAIILDAYCKIKPDEDIKEEFISAVLPSLTTLFGKKNKYIPWYILSAGTVNNFSHTIKGASYQHQTTEWGAMVYIKDVPEDNPNNSEVLYRNIIRVAKERANNIVLYRHQDIFAYLGKDKLIDERARKAMLKMLSALYIPEENIKYEYTGNPLRKVLEYLFRSARKFGLLTDDCFDSKDHIVLLDASRYMAGLTINCYDRRKISHQARWGKAGPEKDGSGGDYIFPDEIAMLVKNILNYSSSDSHTDEEEPYFIDEENKELFFGYVLQLCHVIKWYGKYVEENPIVSVNRKNQIVIKISKELPKSQLVAPNNKTEAEDIKKRKYIIMRDGKTLYCGSCKLDKSIKFMSGQFVIEEFIKNEDDDKDKYPYIAKKIKQA